MKKVALAVFLCVSVSHASMAMIITVNDRIIGEANDELCEALKGGHVRKKETPEEYRQRHENNKKRYEEKKNQREEYRERKSEKKKQYEERIKEKAQSLGLSTYGSIDSIKHAIRQKQYEEGIKERAQSLGLSTYGSIDSIRSQVWQKKDELDRERNERQKANKIIREIKKEIHTYKRKTVYDKDGCIVSDENGRMVGDGRGGTFWAIWGKDDN